MTNPTKASAEPVIWRRWPGKARRKGEGEPEEEKKGRGRGKRERGGREVGVGRRRNTAAKGRRRRPELTRLVTRESALQAAGRASAKARRWACEVGSAECKGRRGVSEGTDGSSSRQAPCRTSGADSELPRTTTTTSRCLQADRGAGPPRCMARKRREKSYRTRHPPPGLVAFLALLGHRIPRLSEAPWEVP